MKILQRYHATYKYLFKRERLPSLITGFILLSVSFLANHFAFVYAHAYAIRPTSSYVGDIILDNLPVVDLNPIIVEGMLIAIVVGILYVLSQSRYVLFTMKTLALFIITRALFMSLTHIGIYPDHIQPGLGAFDSVYLFFNFQTGLFFSGHTCVPYFLALIFWEKKTIRYICFAVSFIFGISVLVAHVHYSIDVFAAPFMAYGIFNISKYLFHREYFLIKPEERPSI
ncbi:MAG: phosphatase PAP2-related protein [Candidatus Kaiserbacteria bacterium]|nr:phosphatase PAP2-related protein [Candidatus Kaiserbacteria bacterium]